MSGPDAATSISGVERAAVLMMLVGEEEAAAILQKLDPDEVQELGRAMFSVADIGESQVMTVLDDFVGHARGRTGIGFDPRPHIETVLHRALGHDRAGSVLARITPAEDVRGLDMLAWMDPAEIADIVESEHPQIAAVLMANLAPEIAAKVLQLLPEPMQPDLVHRVAKLGPVPAEAMATLKTVLARRKPGAGKGGPGVPLGGTKEAAAIMNNAAKATEQRVIARLNKLDKVTAQAIEDQMFVFEHLLALDDKSMGTLLRSVEADILVVALKGVDETMRSRFLGCMSSRAADGIRDEMEARGPVKMAEVIEAQKVILTTARQLANAGTIQMGGKGDDYV